jgi:superfamily I DNA/RNA helicase/mRNA-degrading endonuclease RelE of RelBE toxin-antitoxin system
MEFRIADTFTDSLAKLTGEEQKVVKTTAFDLQMNPANPSMQFHRVERAKDKNFWSVRAGSDLRIIVHKTDTSLLLCYVGHHDPAYKWAERRKLQTHPKTGAAQLVEVRELVKEITIPKYVEEEQPAKTEPLLFDKVSDDSLLGYGVPLEWLPDVKEATDSSFFALADHLPNEAAEALLELVSGSTPEVAAPVALDSNPFDHPDAQRRFRVMKDVEELARALDYPWEKWAVFLHPAQRDLVEREYNGPARVAGSAGTGKTVVALHRVVHLARIHPTSRLLLTTFSDTLASFLKVKVRRLASGEPSVLERIEVHAIEDTGRRLYRSRFGELQLADENELLRLLYKAGNEVETHRFSDRFLWTEWKDVVDAWQLDSWEAYRDVPRLGRKTRLGESQRRLLWDIFQRVRIGLSEQNLLTASGMFFRLTQDLQESGNGPYDFAVVDEAQDMGVAELRFLAALGASRPDSLFFAGDLGQRIFQPPFSWKSLGVDIRGRSRTLRINYRTSHQIRMQADKLLPPEMSDVDGNAEKRRGTMSAFNGPVPQIHILDSEEQETQTAADWLKSVTSEGVLPHEIGVFVRSNEQIKRARHAIEGAGLEYVELQGNVEAKAGRLSIMTMHQAKGLEFRAVLVMACDDEILPLQERISDVADDADLEDVYNTERHLLYVACTRAREYLLATGVDPASEFLDDLS